MLIVFAAVGKEYFFATVNRGNVMSRMNKVSMMTYGILQAQLTGAEHNGRINKYWIPILVAMLFIYMNSLILIVWYFGDCMVWFESICQVFLLYRNDNCCNFVAFLASSLSVCKRFSLLSVSLNIKAGFVLPLPYTLCSTMILSGKNENSLICHTLGVIQELIILWF